MINSRYLRARLRRTLRFLHLKALDVRDLLLGQRDPMVPPHTAKLVVGGGDFREVGEEFKGYFVRYCNIAPSQRILEIGSGYGRMAIPLTTYLDSRGSYDGVEIVHEAVRWCEESITKRHSNFRFHHADIHNGYSNPEGRLSSSSYRLPFDDDWFDFVFLTSVFSHLKPADVEAYVAEIARVLKSGGVCLITWYLLDEFSKRQIEAGNASLPFTHELGGYYATSDVNPENAIAYAEPVAYAYYRRHDLVADRPLYGRWSARQGGLSYQDMVVARKP